MTTRSTRVAAQPQRASVIALLTMFALVVGAASAADPARAAEPSYTAKAVVVRVADTTLRADNAIRAADGGFWLIGYDAAWRFDARGRLLSTAQLGQRLGHYAKVGKVVSAADGGFEAVGVDPSVSDGPFVLGRVAAEGAVTTIPLVGADALPVSSATVFPWDSATGSDGALYFASNRWSDAPGANDDPTGNSGATGALPTSYIGRVDRATGATALYPVPGLPFNLAAGPAGAIWFTSRRDIRKSPFDLMRITSDGSVRTVRSGLPKDITTPMVGTRGGGLWFMGTGYASYVAADGAIRTHRLPYGGCQRATASGVARDGSLWLVARTQSRSRRCVERLSTRANLVHITTAGTITEIRLPFYPVGDTGGSNTIIIGASRRFWIPGIATSNGRTSRYFRVTLIPKRRPA
jgi:hypothetical protein